MRSSSTMPLDSRSQILMELVVAATSQYLLGENTSEWMMSPASREYSLLPSVRSQSMAMPSLPPDAHREPSGETVTLFRYPLCPSRLVLNLQLARDQTLTTLSQPAETMTGAVTEGENLTHETHSVWPSSTMVYLHSPRVFQILTVRSREPETICLFSAEKATERTSLVWPTKRRVHLPVSISQRRRVASHEPERAN